MHIQGACADAAMLALTAFDAGLRRAGIAGGPLLVMHDEIVAKHFTAYDPVAKWTVALVAGRATARCAAALLDKLIAEAPFRIEGIQVDYRP